MSIETVRVQTKRIGRTSRIGKFLPEAMTPSTTSIQSYHQRVSPSTTASGPPAKSRLSGRYIQMIVLVRCKLHSTIQGPSEPSQRTTRTMWLVLSITHRVTLKATRELQCNPWTDMGELLLGNIGNLRYAEPGLGTTIRNGSRYCSCTVNPDEWMGIMVNVMARSNTSQVIWWSSCEATV